MSYSRVFVASFFVWIFFNSCGKQTVDSGPASIPATWGKLSVIRQQVTRFVLSDTLVSRTELAQANFYEDPKTSGALVNAGNVFINDKVVTRNTDESYMLEGADLAFASGVVWRVEGNISVPKFDYQDTLPFPQYIGSFPLIINRSGGLELVLDGSTVSNADSVRIWIDDADGHLVQQTFAASAGVVSVSPASLSSLSANSTQTAVIAIMPYAGRVKAVGNKGFFFVREERLFRSVSIN